MIGNRGNPSTHGPGYEPLNKWGGNADVDQADATAGQIIWPVKAATQVYLFLDAALALTLQSSDAADVTAAGTLTLSANVGNNETVTIGTKVYTFQTALTDVDGNVLIGAAATNSIDNLIAAINLAAGAGTTYATSTTANSDESSAVAGVGDTMTLYVDSAGAIATTETSGTAAWGAANAVLGTGVHSITGSYHDDSGNMADLDLNLKGITAVPLPTDSFGVFRFELGASGTGNTNAGQLTIENGGNIYATIEIGEGQTQIAVVRCPNNKTGLIKEHDIEFGRASPATNTASTRLKIRKTDGTIITKWDPFLSSDHVEDKRDYGIGGLELLPGEWVYWEAIAVSADNTPLRGNIDVEFVNA